MIQVLVRRNPDNTIGEIKIDGHAGYADAGEDLVCAGVSAVTFGIANAIEELLDTEVVHTMGDSGFLHFMIPAIVNQDRANKIQLLMESLLISLRTIEESYQDYIQIQELK